MSKSTPRPTVHMKLREEAETRLKTGTAPTNPDRTIAQGALVLLHRLSSDPASAGDALKLLHELQVHQVELDLQMGQIEANEHELAEALTQFQMLYDFAPFAYFVVDRTGKIAKSNRMGADLTGVGRDDLAGHRIDSFLQPESRPKLLTVLKQLDNNARTVEVFMDGPENIARALTIVARLCPDAKDILLACYECLRAGQT